MSGTTRRPRPGRTGILAAATDLFAASGVAGTSLQQIAEAAGVSKAAVYHHFATKEEIVAAVLEPAFATLEQIVRTARAHAGPAVRTESVIIGLADQAVQHRQLWSVMLQDATVAGSMPTDPAHEELFDGLFELLAGGDGDDATGVRVSVFLSGLLGPLLTPRCADVSDDDLRVGIIESGRRLLLSPPVRSTTG